MPLEKCKNVSVEDALDHCLENPVLRVVSGSRLYGTARFDEKGNIISDTDLREIILPPFEFLTLIRKDFETKNGSQSDDHVVYSLNFFVQKLISANPQFIELLFAPENMILIQNEIGKELIGMRNSFVSKRYFHSMRGFAYSEYRKARGEKLIFEEHTVSEEHAWDTFRETFGKRWGDRRKEITDDIKAMAYSQHTFTLVPSVDGISKKRRSEFDMYGYCSSSACHSLRILRQAAELLRTGTITFPRPDAVELRDIKMGLSTREKFSALYEDAKADAEDAFKESKLPMDADKPEVVKWLDKQTVVGIAADQRFRDSAHLAWKI
jgi:hypothetical protein